MSRSQLSWSQGRSSLPMHASENRNTHQHCVNKRRDSCMRACMRACAAPWESPRRTPSGHSAVLAGSHQNALVLRILWPLLNARLHIVSPAERLCAALAGLSKRQLHPGDADQAGGEGEEPDGGGHREGTGGVQGVAEGQN